YRRILRLSGRTIVDLAVEKDRAAHENSHRFRTDESRLVGAQIWPVAFDRLHWSGQAGRVYRRCRRSPRAVARIRAWIAIDHETARARSELLWSRCQRTTPRSAGSRSA